MDSSSAEIGPSAMGIQQVAAHLAFLPVRLDPTEIIDTLLDALTAISRSTTTSP